MLLKPMKSLLLMGMVLAGLWGGSRCRGSGSAGGRGAGAGLHTSQHHGGGHQSEPVPWKEVRPPRVLWRRLRAGVSGQPVGQEGRL